MALKCNSEPLVDPFELVKLEDIRFIEHDRDPVDFVAGVWHDVGKRRVREAPDSEVESEAVVLEDDAEVVERVEAFRGHPFRGHVGAVAEVDVVLLDAEHVGVEIPRLFLAAL
jgi:hypothetical protein